MKRRIIQPLVILVLVIAIVAVSIAIDVQPDVKVDANHPDEVVYVFIKGEQVTLEEAFTQRKIQGLNTDDCDSGSSIKGYTAQRSHFCVRTNMEDFG